MLHGIYELLLRFGKLLGAPISDLPEIEPLRIHEVMADAGQMAMYLERIRKTEERKMFDRVFSNGG